jgi:molecular chaperone GrpE
VNERDERNEEAQRVVIRDKRRIDPATGAARTPAEQVWTPPGAARDDAGAIPPGSAGDGGPGGNAPGGNAPAPGAAAGTPGAAAGTPGAAAGTPGAAAGTDEAASGDAASWQASQAPAAGDAQVVELTARVAELTNDLQRVTAEYANYRKRVERDRALVAEVATGSVLAALLPVLDDLDRARAHGDLTGAFKAVADQLESVLGKLGLTPVGEPGDRFDPTVHEAVSHQTSAQVTESTCVAVLRRGYAYRDRLLRPALVAVADPGEPDSGGQEPAAADPAGAGSAGAGSAADAPGEQT